MSMPQARDIVGPLRAAYREAGGAPAATQRAADELLAAPATGASALLAAATVHHGHVVTTFEPEALWLSLEKLHESNQQELLAAITVAVNGDVFNHVRPFTAVIEALNGYAVHHGRVPHCSAANLAWGLTEARAIFEVTEGVGVSAGILPPETPLTPTLSDEIVAYVAVALFHEGFVVAPKELAFADEALAEQVARAGVDGALRAQVKKALAVAEEQAGDAFEAPAGAVGTQVFRLFDVASYVKERAEATGEQLRRLA